MCGRHGAAKRCKVNGCDKRADRLGMCYRHYNVQLTALVNADNGQVSSPFSEATNTSNFQDSAKEIERFQCRHLFIDEDGTTRRCTRSHATGGFCVEHGSSRACKVGGCTKHGNIRGFCQGHARDKVSKIDKESYQFYVRYDSAKKAGVEDVTRDCHEEDVQALTASASCLCRLPSCTQRPVDAASDFCTLHLYEKNLIISLRLATGKRERPKCTHMMKMWDGTEVPCENVAMSGGACRQHGAGRQCAIDTCWKRAMVGQYCKEHALQQKVPLPFFLVQREASYCMQSIRDVDGSVKACGQPAVPSRGLCALHGGGQKCSIEGCTRYVVIDFMCKAHAKNFGIPLPVAGCPSVLGKPLPLILVSQVQFAQEISVTTSYHG